MDSTYLKYGDQVLIYGETVRGFLSSQGYTNPNCYIQIDSFKSQVFSRNTRDWIFQVFPKLNYDASKDYDNALKFYQRNIQKNQANSSHGDHAKNQLGGAGEHASTLKRQAFNVNPHQRGGAPSNHEEQNFQKKLMQLQKKLSEEEEFNRKILERRRGEIVTYGSEIQLYHVDSDQFLIGLKTCADLEKTCNQLTLTNTHVSQAAYFKVMPRYKYRQEGEKVLYGDQVVLHNVKLNLYMHISERHVPMEKPIPLPKIMGKNGNPLDKSLSIIPYEIDRRSFPLSYVPMHEVNISTTLSRFQIFPFCQHYEDDRHFVRGSTVIRLQHSELGGYLASDSKDFTNDGLAEVFLWTYKGRDNQNEQFNTFSLFEIEIADTKNKGRVCTLSKDKGDEGIGCQYRLRHLNTGRLVTIQEIEHAGQKLLTLGLAKHLQLKELPSNNPLVNPRYTLDEQEKEELDDMTLFNFISTNIDSNAQLKNHTCVKIQHVKTKQYLSIKKKAVYLENPSNSVRGSSTNKIDAIVLDDTNQFGGQLFQPLADSEITEGYRHILELKPVAGHEDAFFISIEDEETLEDIMTVHTAIGLINKNIPYLTVKPDIPKDKAAQLESILRQMISFMKCEDRDNDLEFDDGGEGEGELLFAKEKGDDDINNVKEKTLKRQKIMRELYIIELLVQILYYPFATGTYDQMQIKQGESITTICSLTYELLELSIGGYSVNELYASQWINFFLMQAMKTNKDNDIQAQSTVNELLSDNKKLLEVQINSQIIQQFITLIKGQEKEKKLIQLLIALCSCHGKPIVNNQNDIIKYLVQNADSKEKLMMPIKKRETQVEVYMKPGTYLPVKILKNFSYEKDDGRIYKYFLALVNLCRDMCTGRNSMALYFLQDCFPFDCILQIIYDHQVPFELRSQFVGLLIKMYLDREPIEQLQIPTHTIIVTEIPNFKELLESTDNGYQIQQQKVAIPPTIEDLKKFVHTFVQNEKGVQDISEKQKNKFVHQILELLEFMLNFGFYQNQEELNQIALPLINILDGTDDQYGGPGLSSKNSKQIGHNNDRYKYNKENEMILKTKKIQCECLNIISQLETDGRAQLFLAKLKWDQDQQNLVVEDKKSKNFMSPILNVLPLGSAKGSKSESIEKQTSKGPEGDKSDRRNRKGSNIDDEQNESLLNKSQSSTLRRKMTLREDPTIYSMSPLDLLQRIAGMKGFESQCEEAYVCVLFDLLLYNYPELNNAAFKLLVQYFTRKRTLLEQLSKIQILETDLSIEVLNKVKIYQNELKIHQSEADIWIAKKSPSAVEQKKRVTLIFTFLASFIINQDGKIPITRRAETTSTDQKTRGHTAQTKFTHDDQKQEDLIKLDDDSKDMYQIETNYEADDYIIFIDDPFPENKEIQRIMRNFEMHQFAVFYIKYRLELADAQTESHVNLVKACYRFLIRFVRYDAQNQQLLRDHLDFFIRDIANYAMAALLVYQIVLNNKKLLSLNVVKLMKQMIEIADEASMDSSRKACIYRCLTSFVKCKYKLVRANQSDVIILVTQSGMKSSMLFLLSSEGFQEQYQMINASKEIEFKQIRLNMIGYQLSALAGQTSRLENAPLATVPTIEVSPAVYNIMSFIELLIICCEGKSDIAEMKCQKEILTLEIVYSMLEASEYFWPLKRTLIDYVSHCFFDTANEKILGPTDTEGLRYVWLISGIIINDMINILDNIAGEEDIYIKYPSSQVETLKEAALQFLTSIIEFFRQLCKRKRMEIKNEHEKILYALAKSLVRMDTAISIDHECKTEGLEMLKYFYQSRKYAKFLDGLKHPFVGSTTYLMQGVGGAKQKLQKQNTKDDEKKSSRRSARQSNRYGVRESERKKVEKPNDDSQASIIHGKGTQITMKIHQLANNSELKDLIEKEYEEFIGWIDNIEEKIKDFGARDQNFRAEAFSNLTFNAVVTALLRMLDSKLLDKPLHLTGLKVIRKIVEIENEGLMTPAADWDTDDWIRYKGVIKAKQNALVDIGCVQFLCKHISEMEDDEIVEEAFLSSIALLLGGNQKSQEAFLNYMQTQDEQNRVLLKIKAMMLRHFENTKAYLNEKNAKLVIMVKWEEELAAEQKRRKIKEKLQQIGTGAINKFIGQSQLPIDDEESEEELLSLENSLTTEILKETNQEQQDKRLDEANLFEQNKIGAINKCIRILRLLQLFTENHYTPFQNFLREQYMSNGVINPKSYDFVTFVSTILGVYENSFVNCYSCNLGYQMLETLTEFIQGPCKENQRALVNAKVIDNCRDMISQCASSERELKMKGFVGPNIKMLDSLKMKSIRLLLSIIEGSIEPEIIKNITMSLDDFAIIFERLKYVYMQFAENELNIVPAYVTQTVVNQSLKKDSFQGDIQEGFDLFILISTLADCYPEAKQKISKYMDWDCYKFFETNTGYIEIQENSSIHRVYFPIQPVCRFLSSASRDHLMLTIDRQSPQHKIIGLLKAVPDLIDEMEHVELLSRSKIQITPDRINFLRDFSTMIGVAICLIILIEYRYDIIVYEDGNMDVGPYIDPTLDLVITILGFIQLVTSCMLFIGWMMNKANLIIKAGWRQINEDYRIQYQAYVQKKKGQSEGAFNEIKAIDLPLYDARMLLLTEGPESPEFQAEDGKKDFGYWILKVEYLWISSSFVFKNGSFNFFLIYIALSVLGLFQSPIFYSFQLLDIINRFATLKNVIQAVTLNKNQLLMTAMLGLIIIYIYSCLGFTFFFDMYFNEDIVMEELDEKGDQVCQNLLHCFVSTINFGLRAGGGIGESMPSLSFFNNTKEEYYFRVIFDLSFFMIVIIMFLNIIFGIIIDTFAELREKKNFIDEDMKNVCFICNIDRQTLDRDSELGFTTHLKKEHNLWQYVYFIIHLKTKDKIDYNGIESYVHHKLLEEDISWVPLHCSICLEKDKYVISDSDSSKPKVVKQEAAAQE